MANDLTVSIEMSGSDERVAFVIEDSRVSGGGALVSNVSVWVKVAGLWANGKPFSVRYPPIKGVVTHAFGGGTTTEVLAPQIWTPPGGALVIRATWLIATTNKLTGLPVSYGADSPKTITTNYDGSSATVLSVNDLGVYNPGLE